MNALTKRQNDNFATIQRYFKDSAEQMLLAMPAHLSNIEGVKRLERQIMTEVRRNPALLEEVDPLSVLAAAIATAQLGLSGDGNLGEVYMVPYKRIVKLIIGYKGYMQLARRSANVHLFLPAIVYENDYFKMRRGLHPQLDHVEAEDGKRGKIKGVYVVATFFHGEPTFHYMPKSEVDKIRNSSPGNQKPSSPWNLWYTAMMIAKCIRQLCKYLPLSAEDRQLKEAIAIDELGDAGLPQGLGEILDIPPKSVQELSEKKSEALKEKIGKAMIPALEADAELPSAPEPESRTRESYEEPVEVEPNLDLGLEGT